jgi:molybdopterin-containing oxidoreductase family iron-sulfur binding subunit
MQNFNPDVSVRPQGVVEKCTFCHHRLQHVKEQADAAGRQVAPEGEYVPACVQACPAQALFFGDLDDPQTQVGQLSKSSRAFRLLEELGTAPKVYYLSEGEWRGGRRA